MNKHNELNSEDYSKSTHVKMSILLKKLINEGLKEYKCENPECGISEWHGKPITLQLHHKNGEHCDNRIENLQLLCPNCHSQTDNFCGRNRKKIQQYFYCKKCGKQIYQKNESGLCIKCYKQSIRNPNRPSKEVLLDEIKQYSFCLLGKKYSVSEATIRKWCKQEGLPYKRSEIKKLYSV